VEEIAARDQLDRIGDDLAADQRGAHAGRAHGDPVGDRDGVELHRRAPGLADAVLDRGGELAQVQVAGADLGPGGGQADDGAVERVTVEAGGAQQRPRPGAAGAAGDRAALPFAGGGRILAHCERIISAASPICQTYNLFSIITLAYFDAPQPSAGGAPDAAASRKRCCCSAKRRAASFASSLCTAPAIAARMAGPIACRSVSAFASAGT